MPPRRERTASLDAPELLDEQLDGAEQCCGFTEGCSCERCTRLDRINRLSIAKAKRMTAGTRRRRDG